MRTGPRLFRGATGNRSLTNHGKVASSEWQLGSVNEAFTIGTNSERRLITEISSADEHGDTSTYYECFLKAFERLMLDKGICFSDELDRRATDSQLTNVENSESIVLVKD
jgi:hypothetical protein